MTRWLKARPYSRVEDRAFERPLLHACSGHDFFLGDVRVDAYTNADVRADIRHLPFKDDSFGAVFADLPWTAAFKRNVADTMKEFLRVAPVAYVIGPWTWGSSSCRLTDVEVCWQPGVVQALLFQRYVRAANVQEVVE